MRCRISQTSIRSPKGIEILLAPDGSCVIEDPYWGDVVARTAFDQIYDEHASYFTLSSLSWLFAQHGLDVVDAIPFDVHGGSMRYLIGTNGIEAVVSERRRSCAIGNTRWRCTAPRRSRDSASA